MARPDDTQPTRLLVVDDEIENINLVERTFANRKRFTLFTAADGQTALTLLNDIEVDIVLTDQRMPGLTGVEMLRRLPDRGPRPTSILVTAYPSLDEVKSAKEEGLFRYLVVKPWVPADLVQIVELVASLRRMGKAAKSLPAN